MSMSPGFPEIATCTSWTALRSATTPLDRATAEMARAERHVFRLDAKDAGQPDGDVAVGDRQQCSGAVESGHLCGRLGEFRGFAERPDAEDRRRAAMQHDPIVDALSREERLPACFTHRSTSATVAAARPRAPS
jgi:hypothetical protein